MKTTAALATLAVFFGATIESVSAGCYTGGASWANRADAIYHVGRACRGYDGKTGAMQGFFSPGGSKSFCYQYGNQKWEFSITNLNQATGFDLADGDCALRLSNEISGCEHGGESDVSGWRFRSDPNDGFC